jgi:hypothetical protein
MSAGSLAKLAPVSMIELEDPEEVTPQLMASLSIKEADGAETLVHQLEGRDPSALGTQCPAPPGVSAT